MNNLDGKVIIITGGTGILGEAFNKSIAAAGAVVGILGRNETIARQRAEEIIKQGGRAEALVADVLQEDQLRAAADKMLSSYGRIDGLVNAAGGNLPDAVVQPGADIFSLNIDALEKVMRLNLFGTILPTQIFGPVIRDSAAKGSIVNISSVSAQKALTRVLGYSLAKSSVEAYTRWFAAELANRYGDTIRMNAIVPGFFLTEQNKTLLTKEDGSFTERGNTVIAQTPFKRFGKPEELCGALIWLLGDESAFVTGTVVNIDGGFLAFSGV